VLRKAYFDAIGMRGWTVQPRYDGAVLSLDLEDMGRLGLLVLARGRWGSEQIIPQDFVEALETKQTRGMKVNYNGPDDGTIELDLPEAPYGFMTWVNTDRDVFPNAGPAWAWGSGAGGHAVYWNRELGIVLAVQGRRPGMSLPELVEAGVRGPNPLAP
jgi:CubicO group peptidase (beta-lactamase class C family)